MGGVRQVAQWVEWLDLESVIENEVSQKGKNKYHVLMCVCVCVCMVSRKVVQMNLFAGHE